MPRIDLDNAQLVLLLDTLRNIEDERVDELYQLIRDPRRIVALMIREVDDALFE